MGASEVFPLGIVRNHNGAKIECRVCGVSFTVPHYRRDTAKYCGKKCSGTAHAKAHLNKGPKPWAAANLDGHRHKSSSRFPKGHKPWNDGLKGLHLSPETEFKKGQEAINKLPLGSVTIRPDKNGRDRSWVKTGSGWRPLAQVNYERAFGPIPEGHVVHHKDHNSLNDDPSNLEALTPADHARVHHAT